MAKTAGGLGEGLGTTGPDTRATGAWIFKLSLAYLAVNITWAGPGQVLIAPQIEHLTNNAPLGFLFTADKETNLALISFVAGMFALVSTPLWGALSDRTSSRWGRRTPWIAMGTVVMAIALVATGFAWSLPAMMFSWVITQAVINAIISPLSAAVPDHVPTTQRGFVSGWWGFAYTLAVVLGTVLGTVATAVWDGMFGIRMGYILCAVAFVVAMLPFIFDTWERGVRPIVRDRFDVKAFLSCYYVNIKKYPDFAWAWLSRFAVTLSSAIALFYLYYYLQDEIGLVRDDSAATTDGLRVADGVLILTVAYAVSVFLTVVVAGGWSDKLGRRRIFVTISSMFYVVACLMMAFASDYSVVVVAAVILGLGTGIFTSVDFALVTEVLPTAEDSGKDIGIIHLAVGLPNVLSPVIAGIAVKSAGGFTNLYLVAAAMAVVGGLLVYRIKSVR